MNNMIKCTICASGLVCNEAYPLEIEGVNRVVCESCWLDYQNEPCSLCGDETLPQNVAASGALINGILCEICWEECVK